MSGNMLPSNYQINLILMIVLDIFIKSSQLTDCAWSPARYKSWMPTPPTKTSDRAQW